MTQSRCLKTVMLLSDYFDGDLSGPTRVQLQLHLAVCPHCGTTYRTLARTILLFKAYANARLCPRRMDGTPGAGRSSALD